MRTVKTVVALALALMLVLSLSACSKNEANLTFELNAAKDGYVLTLVENVPDDFTVPSEYEGLPVTEIGTRAFMGTKGDKVKKLTIPESVKVFQEEACKGLMLLTDLYVPSVKWLCEIEAPIGSNGEVVAYSTPMSYAENLYIGGQKVTEIVVPEGVTKINAGAFKDTEMITSVKLPDGLVEIGTEAFRGLYELGEITVPESVTTLGRYAFAHCYAMKSATLNNPELMIHKGSFDVFYKCDELTDFYFRCSQKATDKVPATGVRYHYTDGIVER